VGRVSGAAVPTSHPHPNRIRRSPSQDATQPVWAPPGSHPHLAIMGKVAVWWAANGIHLGDPRPTGAAQLPTALALWQHHLDRSPARGSDHNIGRLDIQERPPAPTSHDRRHQDRQQLPNHSRSTRTRHPAPTHRSGPRRVECMEPPNTCRQKATPSGHQLPHPALTDQGPGSTRAPSAAGRYARTPVQPTNDRSSSNTARTMPMTRVPTMSRWGPRLT
jgi:hypothetical protein